jgi:hypothetical protein
MKDTRIRFQHGGVLFCRTLSQLLGPRPRFTRTAKGVDAFLREFSPLLKEKFGDYTYRVDGDRYYGYNIIAVDPASPGSWWCETTGFHKTPASALEQWARNKCLI